MPTYRKKAARRVGEHAPARVLDELDAERVEGFQRVTRSFSSSGAAERRDDAHISALPSRRRHMNANASNSSKDK